MHNPEPVRSTVGAKVRALRDERGLSQRELASRAGISANAVSLIERDENSPSVSTLQSLATALNVKMSYFFEDEVQKTILHVKAKQRPRLDSKGVCIEGIGERLRRQEMEPFLITLEPGSGSGSRQVVHNGHEFVYCVEGQIEYLVDGEVHLLQAGDFLLFEAGLPHQWHNATQEKARFLLVLQTPDASGEPVNRHFSSYPSISHIGQ
ncbi:MAG: XRE family transcriptional regulator [Chloroflexota bacterium]